MQKETNNLTYKPHWTRRSIEKHKTKANAIDILSVIAILTYIIGGILWFNDVFPGLFW